MTATEWTLPNGMPMRFQDGDHVEIEAEDPASVPFLTGYVRGYSMTVTDDGKASVAYELFSVGNRPLKWVREECLTRTPGRFGANHGRGAHGRGEECALCGANI